MDSGSEDRVTPLTRTEQAHHKYRQGQYQDALQLYSDALSIATLSAHRIALYSNRAACYLKLQRFKEAAEECSAILELDYNHKGALMLRAQTLVALKDYHSALFDVNRLLTLNPTSEVYREFQGRLRTQLALAPIPEAENESLPPESPRVDRKIPSFETTTVSQLSKNVTHNFSSTDRSRAAQPKGGTATPRSPKSAMSRGDNEFSSQRSQKDFPPEFPIDQSSPSTTTAQKEGAVSNSKGSALCSKSPVSDNKIPISTEGAALHSKGWEAIPKPKGHTGIDYSRWSGLGDDVSDDESDEDSEPQYRYRLRTIGLRAINH
ncbi:hypothetical protein O6H91_20G069800 [Diphasiastrum complanatum]|uniref:Uncharacterized protein n=1 Tax=Diphasiastrum complanatum TaxID=34168 RepID=A0ACC2ASJ9_DIPCM|nr:hypothetical protein O6H91_20G069800 [Diphasiastrum complanatum]